MSLTMKKTVNFVGTSMINGKATERYTASIDSENPEQMNYTNIIQDKELYKENRDQCHADQAEFENYIYSAQDEMIEKHAVVDETEVDDNEENV